MAVTHKAIAQLFKSGRSIRSVAFYFYGSGVPDNQLRVEAAIRKVMLRQAARSKGRRK